MTTYLLADPYIILALCCLICAGIAQGAIVCLKADNPNEERE